MNDTTRAELPDGLALETALTEARAGRLSPAEFASTFAAATVLLAVVDRVEGDTGDSITPFVITVDGTDFGVAFTSPRLWDTFTAQTPFLLMQGSSFSTWPTTLGLAINPGTEPALLLSPGQLGSLASVVGGTTVPAGSSIRVGAPSTGLPPEAVSLIEQEVRRDPGVIAVYQLAIASGDAAPELVLGVEAAATEGRVAEALAAKLAGLDPGFAGIAFIDLSASLLEKAKRFSAPIG